MEQVSEFIKHKFNLDLDLDKLKKHLTKANFDKLKDQKHIAIIILVCCILLYPVYTLMILLLCYILLN